MDPFKVLNMAPIPVKGPRDLEIVRARAKRLWKRYAAEKRKFDAVKVMEAFKMVEQQLKGKPGEGAYKILGRGRKERELDRHFNKQSKEIKKNKDLRRTLRHAQKGERRIHLPGDKERIPRHRRRRRHHRRHKPQKVPVDVIQGLNRLAAVLAKKSSFARAVKLFHRWMKDYMNQDNREYVFKVLQDVATLEFLTDDPDARQDVILVYEYAMTYFANWFDKGDKERLLAKQWQVATVLACRCYTDDAFTLGSTISKLSEVFTLLERSRHEEAAAKAEALASTKTEPKRELKEEVKVEAVSTTAGGNSPLSDGEFSDAADDMSSDDEQGDGCASGADYDDDGSSERQAKKAKLEVDAAANGVAAKEELIDLDSDAEDGVKNEVVSDGGSSSESEAEVEETVFPVPSTAQSLERLSAHFVDRCLAALFQNRSPLWAKPKIDPFFQDVFYRRAVLTAEQQVKVEAWQSRIKTLQKVGERDVGEANNPLQAHRPVVDSREDRVFLDADSNAWAAKQTFDSRDRCAGKIIR